MINLLTANIAPASNKKRYDFEKMDKMLKAQVENSLDIGWKIDDVYLVANFDWSFMGVKAYNVPLNEECLTGSKMFAVKWLIDHLEEDKVIFAHDLDAWQNIKFKAPKFKDVGITTYSTSKLNGGVSFWKRSAKDIVAEVVGVLSAGAQKEEPTLNEMLRGKFKKRTTIIDTSFNVGCSGFFPRLFRAEKPIKVCHLNPLNRIAWETHRLDRNGMGVVSVMPRLELILRNHYPHLATTLSEEGTRRSAELREENSEKLYKLLSKKYNR